MKPNKAFATESFFEMPDSTQSLLFSYSSFILDRYLIAEGSDYRDVTL